MQNYKPWLRWIIAAIAAVASRYLGFKKHKNKLKASVMMKFVTMCGVLVALMAVSLACGGQSADPVPATAAVQA